MRPKVTALLFVTAVFVTFEVFAMDWTELTLTIDEIESGRGGEMTVYIFLKDGFPTKHERALKNYRFDVTQQTHQIIIEAPDVPFAIKTHHDEDRSGKSPRTGQGFIPPRG